jgi:NADH dehydrogenase
VNLVGILHESGRQTFQRAHAELPERVVRACARVGVKRYLHMSALCADPAGPSRYLRSKGEGEARAAAGAAQGIDVTIFRPSVIFGRGDSFINLFATMMRFAPVIPLGSPEARFQPVWVGDVVRAMADALSDRSTVGERYDLCGPGVYTLRELVRMTGQVAGCPRPIVGLGRTLSYVQAAVMEWSPVKLITRDNVRSMSVDNVCNCGWPQAFGFQPAALESVLPTYLGSQRCRAFDGFRTRARR